jgi:E3 SUMO-protein ligase PIAS1
VEPNGEWHTADNSYASTGWRANHPPPVSERPPSPQKFFPELSTKPATDQNGNEIVVLDSDDEDEGRVKRELSPSFGHDSPVSTNRSLDRTSVQNSQSQRLGDDVIDLTLDSDDDEPPPPRRLEKRKTVDGGMSPTEQIWKKGRQENEQMSTVANDHVTSAGSINGLDSIRYSHYSPHRSQSSQSSSQPPIASPPTQYIAPFAIHHSYPYSRPARATPSTSTPHLPAVPRNPYRARWPGT